MSDEVAEALRAESDYADVIRPYLTASDIAESPRQVPSRWIIDFGQRSLETASRYPRALAIVRDEVKPFRDKVRREGHRTKWWQFGEPRVGLRAAITALDRYIAIGRGQVPGSGVAVVLRSDC